MKTTLFCTFLLSFSLYAFNLADSFHDDSPPVDALALTWDDTISTPVTLTNSDTIIARWIPSSSPDLNTQIIRFYDDVNCSGNLLEVTPAQSSVANNFTFSSLTVDGQTYSFSVSGIDFHGNEDSIPPCSPAILIDLSGAIID